MADAESFRTKLFTVADNNARIRNPENLLLFEKYSAGDVIPPGMAVGDFKLIPLGVQVKVTAIKSIETGSSGSILFCLATSADGATVYGWTSTRNFKGKFAGETLGIRTPPPASNSYGPNAAWSGGAYLGQVDLVDIVDNSLEIERIALSTLQPFQDMVAAASADDIAIGLNSGFRSYPEQKILYDGFIKGLPGYNKAAKPGRSKHQNGIAFDIPVAGGDGNPTYDWLTENATSFGFVRTVTGEPWHWEYDVARATDARNSGTYKTPNVTD